MLTRARAWVTAVHVLAAGAAAVTAGGGSQPPAAAPGVRPPALAGTFYPADAGRLRAAAAGYLAAAVPSRGLDPRVLVVPHAAWVFSGQIAADAFRQVERPVETVIVLAPNHTLPSFRGVSVYDGDAWDTPLGPIRVDRTLAAAVLDAGIGAVREPAVHTKEHAIEVHVPFLQVRHPGAAILPIVVGSQDPGVCARLGRTLARLAAGASVLIVASSDLAHYPSAADARRLDKDLLEGWLGGAGGAYVTAAERAVRDPDAVPVPGLATRACGLGPLLAAREAARALGAERAVVLSYANSADSVLVAPDRAVGYAAVMFADGSAPADTAVLDRPKADERTALDDDDKRVLLRLARASITQRLSSDTLPLPRGGSARLLRETGAFVTLKARGELRGCIGRILPDGPLVRLVSAMALEAAFADPRFAPVTAREAAGLEIEVSVLTRPREIARVDDIRPGRDGVMMQLGDKAAVFLPQVATEQGWTRMDLLENLALKAGLPASAWRDRKARFQVFQADVFSERDLRISAK